MYTNFSPLGSKYMGMVTLPSPVIYPLSCLLLGLLLLWQKNSNY